MDIALALGLLWLVAATVCCHWTGGARTFARMPLGGWLGAVRAVSFCLRLAFLLLCAWILVARPPSASLLLFVICFIACSTTLDLVLLRIARRRGAAAALRT